MFGLHCSSTARQCASPRSPISSRFASLDGLCTTNKLRYPSKFYILLNSHGCVLHLSTCRTKSIASKCQSTIWSTPNDDYAPIWTNLSCSQQSVLCNLSQYSSCFRNDCQSEFLKNDLESASTQKYLENDILGN